MISITFYKDNTDYYGIRLMNHAGYAEEGEDIVCAAVSALAINTFNSIETFTEVPFLEEVSTDHVTISFRLTGTPDFATNLLMKSLELGLQDLKNNYSQYLSIDYDLEEV